MNIRTTLTVRYVFVTGLLVALACVLIYLLSADYREADFYERLRNKAVNTAKLLIEVDEVDVNLLRRIERDNPVSLPHEKIIIYNYQDTLLFSTDDERAISISQDLLNHIRLEDEVRFRQGDFEVLGFLFKARYDRFVVIAAARDIFGMKRLKNLIYILSFVFGISLLVALFFGWVYSGKALEPIARVVTRVDEITIASLDLRLNEGNGTDEIARLSNTFNNMLERLETSFKAQKDFISNASHELRTPLTALTAQLEVTRLNTRSIDEYKNLIDSLLEDIRKLTRLANRLLLLAHSSGSENELLSDLRVDEILWEAQDEVCRYDAANRVTIDLAKDLDEETRLTIRGDEQLLRVAFLNLMENSCKYSEDHTCIVSLVSSPAGIEISFRDNGIGIPQSDMDHIFSPFYRGANTTGIPGHGIGLSMVKSIVKLHHGNIVIKSTPGAGTEVVISLPILKSLQNV